MAKLFFSEETSYWQHRKSIKSQLTQGGYDGDFVEGEGQKAMLSKVFPFFSDNLYAKFVLIVMGMTLITFWV